MPYGTHLFTPDWMPLREAASVIGVHPRTISNRIRDGKMPGVRMINLDGLYRIHRGDWQRHLENLQAASRQSA